MRASAGVLARAAIAGALLLAVSSVLALDGEVRMHDPSTVVQADGKFYVYGTGHGLPAFVSDDGWTWRRAGQVMQHVHELGFELRLDVSDGPVRSQVTSDACWIKGIADDWRTAMLAEGWA